MTRSNRKTAIIWSKIGYKKTTLKCYECGKFLLHKSMDIYICSECGLEQAIVTKLSELVQCEDEIGSEDEDLTNKYDVDEDYIIKKRFIH